MTLGYGKWLFCALLCLAVLAPAANARVTGTTLGITQELFSSEGHPLLVANSLPSGGKPIDWQRCFPDAATCVQLPNASNPFEPGPTAAGTLFKASIAGEASPEVISSRVWQGAVKAAAPPTITGSPKVGQIVTGAAGSWVGGWGTDRDSVTVMACKRPSALKCDVVTGAWQLGDGSSDLPIAPKYLGWILYAVNVRLSGDEVFPLMQLPRIRPNPLLTSAATKSISNAVGPVAVDPAYIISLRKQARYLRSGSALLGRVGCAADCSFSATIRLRYKKSGRTRGPRSRAITKRLTLNDRLVLRHRQLRGARSALVTITDRHQIVGQRTILLKRN